MLDGRAYELDAAERGPHLAAFAAAGVTWWLEAAWADVAQADIQNIITQGPPQLNG